MSIQSLSAQPSIWTLDDCIQYALEKNIQVQKAYVSSDINSINLKLARYAWLPSLSANVRQNIDWNNQMNTTSGSTVFRGTNGTNISVSSDLPVFNGFRLRNAAKRAETEYEAGQYNIDLIKETVRLNVLNAYLQVLFAEEQVANDTAQIGSTKQQLNLASERLKLGAIATSDYLPVKSQLATEVQTLTAAESQLAISRITLIQLMELPDTIEFTIEHPNLDSLINQERMPDAVEVYRIAHDIRPEVKNAQLNVRSAEMGTEVAKGANYPNVFINGGLSDLYTGSNASSFGNQLSNNISPSLGITASIPIFTNRQVKSNVEIADQNTLNAKLDLANVENQLRKSIEQACQDVISSQSEYEANYEAYSAVKESFDVASEKYFQGLLNSVDLLVQKARLIATQSTLLQSRYRLIFSYKVLDFYTGRPLSFDN